MKAPDRLWVPHLGSWDSLSLFKAWPVPVEGIVYRRETTCVWVQDDDDHGIKWYRSPHGERAPEDQIADWPYCRGCGDRIEVKE